MKTKWTTVSIPEELVKRLHEKMDKSFTSDSERIRYIIRAYLNEYKSS